MASEFFTDITAGTVFWFGMSADQILVLFTLFFALGTAIYFSVKTDNKDLGVLTFFVMLITAGFFGIVSFTVIALPLILIGMFYFFFNRNGGDG